MVRGGGVPVPKENMEITNGLIGFVGPFNGKDYVNIRKTYEKEGEEFLGKGLCISIDAWQELSGSWSELKEYIDNQINGE
ncbi:hypothetical protein CL614_00405 [archaeon]|nr:hypothetical protein [archaeon]|tara:strand:+ start:344 stop:583 length:240 start_codon:yes stop_codon:yes gene_type:complete